VQQRDNIIAELNDMKTSHGYELDQKDVQIAEIQALLANLETKVCFLCECVIAGYGVERAIQTNGDAIFLRGIKALRRVGPFNEKGLLFNSIFGR